MHEKFFSDRTALVSGAGSGIGYELVRQLLDGGSRVIATDIDPQRLERLREAVFDNENRLQTFVVDHSNQAAVDEFAACILSDSNPVEILFCNAGIGHSGRVGEIPLEEWRRVVNINFWGQIYLINHFLPPMRSRGRGWIMITASGAGLFPLAAMAPYCCTKSALVTLAHTMRMELATDNIKVCALCPGIINTNIIRDGIISGEQNRSTAQKLYNRFGTHPEVVARAAIRGLKHNQATIRTPLYHLWLNHFLYRFCPGLLLKLGAFLYRKGWNFIGPIVKGEYKYEKKDRRCHPHRT